MHTLLLPLQRLLAAQHNTAVHQVGQVELAERPYGSLNEYACMQGAMPDHDQEKKANSYWMRELIRLRDSIGISSRGPNAGNSGQRHCQPQVPLLLIILSIMSYLILYATYPFKAWLAQTRLGKAAAIALMRSFSAAVTVRSHWSLGGSPAGCVSLFWVCVSLFCLYDTRSLVSLHCVRSLVSL